MKDSTQLLLAFAHEYAGLGDAVQEQLRDLLDDPNADCNPNAVQLISDRLGGYSDDIDAAIAAWIAVWEKHG